jgi:hypothetical protein
VPRLTKVLTWPIDLLKLSGYCSKHYKASTIGYQVDLMTPNVITNIRGGSSERRGTSRFPLREEVRYKVLHSKSLNTTGSGQTLNIGSGGILFTTEERLPVGRMVELSVNWPARLDGTCPLQFVAVGRVVRADLNRAAVRIERYEFRTRRSAVPFNSEVKQ